MSKIVKPLCHFMAVSINSFVLYYDQMYVHIPIPVEGMKMLPFNSRSMFLTFWCLVLQTIYHFVAFLNDIAGTNAGSPKRPPIIRLIKDTLFSLAFTAAIYVSIAFWSIYFIDKDLIFPEALAKVYPPLFNHIMHTFVSVFILIDLLSSHINYPSRKVGLTVLYSFKISYVAWFFVVFAKTGAWPYPIFDQLNWPARIIFIAVSLFIAFVFYLVGEKLNKILCSSNQTYTNGTTKSKSKKK